MPLDGLLAGHRLERRHALVLPNVTRISDSATSSASAVASRMRTDSSFKVRAVADAPGTFGTSARHSLDSSLNSTVATKLRIHVLRTGTRRDPRLRWGSRVS